MTISRILLAALLGAGVAGANAADITVSAAASLTNAFNEIGPAFEAAHPGNKVQFNFGASGALLQQIAKGAPVDVFASADQETMDQAQAQKLVNVAQRQNFASNALAVIVPAGAKKVPATLTDLTHTGYPRIAIGLPASVPVGRYTKRYLEKVGLWSNLEKKMVGGNTVRQILDYVARGEVDAGFVYTTDAALMPDRVKVAFVVRTQESIVYPVAPINLTKNAAAAREFVAYLLSPAAQAILEKYGFGKP